MHLNTASDSAPQHDSFAFVPEALSQGGPPLDPARTKGVLPLRGQVTEELDERHQGRQPVQVDFTSARPKLAEVGTDFLLSQDHRTASNGLKMIPNYIHKF